MWIEELKKRVFCLLLCGFPPAILQPQVSFNPSGGGAEVSLDKHTRKSREYRASDTHCYLQHVLHGVLFKTMGSGVRPTLVQNPTQSLPVVGTQTSYITFPCLGKKIMHVKLFRLTLLTPRKSSVYISWCCCCCISVMKVVVTTIS